MSLMRIQSSFKFPILLMVFWALTFGFLCVGFFHKAPMNMPMMDGMSVSSPVVQSCCGSNMSEHLDAWKNVLTAVPQPQQIRDNLLLLIASFILAIGFTGFPFRYRPPDIKTLLLRFYVKENPDIALFNNLKLAFARGILNPKIY